MNQFGGCECETGKGNSCADEPLEQRSFHRHNVSLYRHDVGLCGDVCKPRLHACETLTDVCGGLFKFLDARFHAAIIAARA
ncbi:hypothetical protein DO72_2466 [Burkholderia pseudomallei]|nr:hypothetical protein DO72_2466 [Burkholderia pseudomallei]KGS18474.1 hypothetical protein X989_4614 [Burkholderia pseudomallei MSHR4378]KGX53844.1 hypothetical protein Y025_4552 [Burkholderia pseudomallei TSV32]KGX69599.1 hypothetical protein Y026_4345 [Burkholderia pseudomallei TSV28]